MTLEKEFLERLFIHKYAVLSAKCLKYYEDLQNTGVTIPNFLQDKTPEEQANEYVVDIILKGLLNEKYELAWNEIAVFMD